jgi:ubiquitin-protein ligase
MVLSERGVKRVMKEISEIRKSTDFSISVDESDLQYVYVIIRNLDGVYTGGEYIFRIKLPDDYPFSPPVICCLTPSGRFQPEVNICLSISHFHRETWSPLITLEKITYSIISIFHDPTIMGVGCINTPPGATATLAKESVETNKKNHQAILEKEL